MIYPLFRDGTAGDYVSQEEIELHDGIFGIKADAWDAILLEQREDYAEDEYARPDFQLTVINREQALRLYDEGKQIYLVRISSWPILVTAREEIERGSDTFQIATQALTVLPSLSTTTSLTDSEFYVVENRQAVPLEIKRFGNLNDAMSQYQALPNHYMKALGVEKNPDPLPGSLDVLQCRNGIDTIVEDYKTVPGWNNPYIQNHVVQPLHSRIRSRR